MRPPVPRLGSHKPRAAFLLHCQGCSNVLRYSRYKLLTPCLVQGCGYRGSFECRVSMRKVLDRTVTPSVGRKGMERQNPQGVYLNIDLKHFENFLWRSSFNLSLSKQHDHQQGTRPFKKTHWSHLPRANLLAFRHLIPKALKHPGNRKHTHTQWPHRT